MWQSSDVPGRPLSPVWFQIDFSRIYGGWLDIKFFSQAQPGNGFYYWEVSLWYYWKNQQGQRIFSSTVKKNEVTSAPQMAEGVWSNVMTDLPAGTMAYLEVAAKTLLYYRPDPNQSGTWWETQVFANVPDILFSKPPDKLVANPPDYGIIPPLNSKVMCHCSVSANAPETMYMAQVAKMDESVIQAYPWQTSSGFEIWTIDAPKTKWRAKAKNIMGEGPWSDWCEFPVLVQIKGHIDASLDAMPNKPIHKIYCSFIPHTAHTLTSIIWNISKWIKTQYAGYWQNLGTLQGQSVAFVMDDAPEEILYLIECEVHGVLYNIESSATFRSEITYYGEIIE